MQRYVHSLQNKTSELRSRTQGTLVGPLFRYKYGSAVNYIEQDWDVLIILDACRSDAFVQEASGLIDQGNFSEVIGYGASPEFVEEEFVDNELHDVVYVGGNGFIKKVMDSDVFHAIEATFDDKNAHEKGWLPEAVYNRSIDAMEKYPNKRYIFHFMQPHTPYLGDKAESLRQQVKNEYNVSFRLIDSINETKEQNEEVLTDLRKAALRNYITDDELWDVYCENLSLVLDWLDQLLDHVSGKVVITADHGELFGDGESRIAPEIYGHSSNIYDLSLRQVPWLEINVGERPEIYEDTQEKDQVIPDENIQENLEDLGYL